MRVMALFVCRQLLARSAGMMNTITMFSPVICLSHLSVTGVSRLSTTAASAGNIYFTVRMMQSVCVCVCVLCSRV